MKKENIERFFNLPSIIETEETPLGLRLRRFPQKLEQTKNYANILFTEIDLKESRPIKHTTDLVFVFYGILNHHLNAAVRHYGANLKRLLELSKQDNQKKIKLMGIEYQFGLDDPSETALAIASLIRNQTQPLPKISFYGISFGGAYAIHCIPLLENQGIKVDSLILQCSPLEENDLSPQAAALFPSVNVGKKLNELTNKLKRFNRGNFNQILAQAMGLLSKEDRKIITNSSDGILANLAAANRVKNMNSWIIPEQLPEHVLYVGTTDDEVVNQEQVISKLKKTKQANLEVRKFESQPGMHGHGIREKLLASVGEEIFQFI